VQLPDDFAPQGEPLRVAYVDAHVDAEELYFQAGLKWCGTIVETPAILIDTLLQEVSL
jgi:hypothetical protein